MPTSEVQDATRLASLLSQDTRTEVEVFFQRTEQRYEVRWAGGPIEDFMMSLAKGHACEVPNLSIDALAWTRS